MAEGTPSDQVGNGRPNRLLATLSPHDFSLLAPHLRTVALERGAILHDVGEEMGRVYFPRSGMVSLVAVMPDGTTVETATVGRAGVVGASAGLGARSAVSRAIVQLSGTAEWLSAHRFHDTANQSAPIRDLIVRYNDLLFAQVQQSVACNALHSLEGRLGRWLLQTHDCVDGDAIPLTQEFLGQMLGARRTTVTIAARLMKSAGLISYRRGRIIVVDRPGLEKVACECYSTIRRQTDAVFGDRATERAVERQRTKGSSLADLLDVLVRTAIKQTGGKARAAFYLADDKASALHHITGMPQAYARQVDGFLISPQSLACGLAAATRQAVIALDVRFRG